MAEPEPEPSQDIRPVGIVLYRPTISRLPTKLQDAERRLLLARIPGIRDFDQKELIAPKIRTPIRFTAIDNEEDAYGQSMMEGLKRMDLDRPTIQAKQRLAVGRAIQEGIVPFELVRKFYRLQIQPASPFVKKSFERDRHYFYA